jgi:response regulator RpfG family c-di-GMP phosphodiesterase
MSSKNDHDLRKKYTTISRKYQFMKKAFTKSRLAFRRLLRNYILLQKRYLILKKHASKRVRDLSDKLSRQATLSSSMYQIVLSTDRKVLTVPQKFLDLIEMERDEFEQSFYIDMLYEKFLPPVKTENISVETEPFQFPVMLKNYEVEGSHIHPYVYFNMQASISYNKKTSQYQYTISAEDVSASVELNYFQKTDTLISSLSVSNYNLMRAKKSIEMHKIMLIHLICSLIEEYNQETSVHLQRIQSITTTLSAECMRLDLVVADNYDVEDYVKDINYTSVLHDIGKMGVPNEILLKEEKLTDEERKMLEHHSLIGAEYIHKIIKVFLSHPSYSLYVDFLRVPYEICRHHHEKWDGSGYPEGLKGEAIPISARIVSVADTYDAIRAHRSYQKARTHMEAVEVIKSESGKQFDPRIVEAFLNIHPQLETISYEANPD